MVNATPETCVDLLDSYMLKVVQGWKRMKAGHPGQIHGPTRLEETTVGLQGGPQSTSKLQAQRLPLACFDAEPAAA